MEATGSAGVEELWEEVQESPRQQRPVVDEPAQDRREGRRRRRGPTELVPPAGTWAGRGGGWGGGQVCLHPRGRRARGEGRMWREREEQVANAFVAHNSGDDSPPFVFRLLLFYEAS